MSRTAATLLHTCGQRLLAALLTLLALLFVSAPAHAQVNNATYNVTAPATPGTYNFQWKMLREGIGWFGAATTNIAVNVGASQTNSATFVSQSVPATMVAGQPYSVTVTMKNTGTTTWTAANSYKLVSNCSTKR